MNRRGQISMPLFVLFGVIVAGYILSIFSPVIDDVRITQLARTGNDEVIQKLILYLLMPIIWGVYILFSIFAVIWATQSAGAGF